MASKQLTHPLTRLDACLVDLQTTGGSPPAAHPLDLAIRDPRGQLHRWEFALPDDAEVARRVRKMHGLDQPRDLAIDPSSAWEDIAATLGPEPLLIAHFASFERRFIEHALPELGARWICTHAIARRLLPEIPRAGLTAIAGYFGHRLSAKHSAPAHVEATAVIWQHLAEMLASEHAIFTLPELENWLASPIAAPSSKTSSARYVIERDHRLGLPSEPGVYRFFDRGGNLLYIGKATDLRARVNSYFRTRRGLSEARLELVSQVARVETEPHATALEAALAEVDAIKAHAPPYNQALLPREFLPIFLNRHAEPSHICDAHHRYGPHFSLRALHEARAIWALEDPWPAEAAQEARARFARDHQLDPNHFGPLTVWLRAGSTLWPPPDPAELEDDDADAPTPEDIATSEEPPEFEEPAELDEPAIYRRLQSCARRLSWQVRRARVLSQLTDARLTWAPPTAPHELRTIELRDAAITHRDTLPLSADLPSAPRPERPFLERLTLLDGPTHDRLRVLATEIRRLLQSSTHVHLRTPRQTLDADALRLLWELF